MSIDLVQKMLQLDASQRITPAEVLHHRSVWTRTPTASMTAPSKCSAAVRTDICDRVNSIYSLTDCLPDVDAASGSEDVTFDTERESQRR